jgi:hypothetical protein
LSDHGDWFRSIPGQHRLARQRHCVLRHRRFCGKHRQCRYSRAVCLAAANPCSGVDWYAAASPHRIALTVATYRGRPDGGEWGWACGSERSAKLRHEIVHGSPRREYFGEPVPPRTIIGAACLTGV